MVPVTVLAERLHKPRNFSAIIRTCDAVGINEVHAVPGDDGLAVHWNTSQGAEKWMNVRQHDGFGAACDFLRERGFQLVAAHLSKDARDYRDIDYTVPTALVVGTELFGVSEEAVVQADCQVMIPMKGMTRSLNVSVACAIVLYEALRQRDAIGLYGLQNTDGVGQVASEIHGNPKDMSDVIWVRFGKMHNRLIAPSLRTGQAYRQDCLFNSR